MTDRLSLASERWSVLRRSVLGPYGKETYQFRGDRPILHFLRERDWGLRSLEERTETSYCETIEDENGLGK